MDDDFFFCNFFLSDISLFWGSEKAKREKRVGEGSEMYEMF